MCILSAARWRRDPSSCSRRAEAGRGGAGRGERMGAKTMPAGGFRNHSGRAAFESNAFESPPPGL